VKRLVPSGTLTVLGNSILVSRHTKLCLSVLRDGKEKVKGGFIYPMLSRSGGWKDNSSFRGGEDFEHFVPLF